MKTHPWMAALLCLMLSLCHVALPPVASAQTTAWRYITVNAPVQTVAVETYRGTYQATFQNQILIVPGGRAMGGLVLTTPDDSPLRAQIFAATVHWRGDRVQRIRVRARQLEPASTEELVIILYPAQAESDECVVYDLVGPGVRASSCEAQGRLTVVR